MLLSEKAYQQIDKELSKFPADQRRSAIMASLAIAQQEKGWVSPEIIEDVAQYIGVEPIAVQEVATFYNMFHTKPVGRVTISVCTNLPCALRDGVKAGEYLKEKLGIDYGETTADGQFSLIMGECMGSCGDSPVMLLNNQHMCVRMEAERIDAMLEELKTYGESA
ncbi:NADH-quinone oxidoreductase subunit NuoE [Alcaligenes ammonioxydans]|jgi:NADH-quinone oxidoreductase subunit E|uniref:NADH-quinone oxidoreductase subunit NuoE n=1 Tax=Alcaligenes ammonioxydans TaxID=2582914 RepID=A0ABX8SXV2_9BURK|nr:NADH-quinone oxidoreductase subunit NuoE [Alcaligenes ammonioxydans]EJC64950.1 NADH dehydrogenase subunit E [Alcaligenes faecalis subsp. faecalis NCIB 8687]QBH18583.1 NADH-quinone oxidoreductase subunit NuoE [Alcaligenes faecalis]MCH1880924.1 NADH-quinone oxidoreductase subunit NuoE [Alcaligenes ammonioxydans]QXX79733.1 NADH-quinone oxidoreductase subunit NuoE [Alcaligenes ammonioxydans]WGQ34681.1 NADH-quinone oxidoreductase subunit NuoE [Alcaligenes faecalis]